MGEDVLCPICKKVVSSPLWDLGWIPKEQIVALNLMEIEAVCYSCWEEHMAQLNPEYMLGVLVGLMGDYVCLIEEHAQLEETTEEQIKELNEQNEELEKTLEDLKDRISDVLR